MRENTDLCKLRRFARRSYAEHVPQLATNADEP